MGFCKVAVGDVGKPHVDCDALVAPSKLRYLGYQDDGTFLPFTFDTNLFSKDSRPRWIDQERDDVSATEGLWWLCPFPAALSNASPFRLLCFQTAFGSIAGGSFCHLSPGSWGH